MATILIIDDNDTIREGLAITVKKLGHEAVTASSGAAGVAAFKQKRADFVIHAVPNRYHMVYRFGVRRVRTVVARGRVVVDEGQLVPRA